MNKYIIETISIIRNQYCIEAKEEDHAKDEIICLNNIKLDKHREFSNKPLEEIIISSRKVSDKEFFKAFDESNKDLITLQSKFKLGFVHKVIYEKTATESLINFILAK